MTALAPSAHVDTFARDNLPPFDQWPVMLPMPDGRYPQRLNAAEELIDKALPRWGDRPAIRWPGGQWTYRELADRVNRIAGVLVEPLGLVPGTRVLLRAANNPMMVACYFAVLKAGGIAVATMPLLRGKELSYIINKAQIDLALCDADLEEEMVNARTLAPRLKRIALFSGDGTEEKELESLMRTARGSFDPVDTAADDVCLIAFTSGTTGEPKGTMHFHRDLLAICDTFSKHVLKPEADDIFCGSPPIAFTFGLGGLVLFPFRVGASTLMLERPAPELLSQAIAEHRPTVCFTAPTAYRLMAGYAGKFDLTSLKKCVSAGETLPLATFEAFRKATGIEIIDGIGSTEMLHIFISAAGQDIRPGATGKPVPGFEARVVDAEGKEVPPGEVGKLAVRGPTGCRYLADSRQANYVQHGWNLTGDAYKMDEDGYFWFQARSDDMIVSAGYNIAGPEVEDALLLHEHVKECAVVGAPHEERGHIVKAFVVLAEGVAPSSEKVKELQDFVKAEIAPFKYPRAIEFVRELPRTETGKVQRFKLRQQEESKAGEKA